MQIYMIMAVKNLLIFLLLLRIISIRSTSAKCTLHNYTFPAILTFGDSSLDPGNNNYIETAFRGNHLPYGQDFPGKIPTGRFSNGKLVPDFLASMLCLKETVPPFLQPGLSDEELLTGVSFASAGSGLDEMSTALTGVISMAEQTEYLKEYVKRLVRIAGEKEARRIVAGALVIVSVGALDHLYNFYDLPNVRRVQFNISSYQDYLQHKLTNFIREIYKLGCRIMVISGLPPMGCLPIQTTLKFTTFKRKCVDSENEDAVSYNLKLLELLPRLQKTLPGSTLVFSDVYALVMEMIQHPQKFGFEDTLRGCCGTGLVEVGPLCNEASYICGNPDKSLFWDSIHPSQSACRFLAEADLKQLLHSL